MGGVLKRNALICIHYVIPNAQQVDLTEIRNERKQKVIKIQF